ncbi:peptidoglycan-binding domain-containing protein [Amycolatopsis sp. NPDC021455]|uniref:peptidoglycan-binding domain-containing protein n=1 Tax=Amycolatopsis sp. NPDC021455 TaxID=3154901 RepID=UPI0033E90832
MKSRSVGTAVLAAATLLGAGASAGTLLRPAGVPYELQAAKEVTSVPVGHEDVTDERTVKISLVTSPAPPLILGLGGRVTSTACAPGTPLKSGQVVARLNETPVIALATSAPLYRDLAENTEGDDVESLQRELARLGHKIEADGKYGPKTVAAVKKLQKAAGIAKPDGVLVAGQVLWLSAPSVAPETCELVQGAFVTPGQTFAKVPARLTAVAVQAKPKNMTPGERIIDVFGVQGPLGADGNATDGEFLREVVAKPEFRALGDAEKPADLTATLILKKPVPALKVPPGALFAVDGDSACVQSGRTVHKVQIVGSRLGATLVKAAEPITTVELGSAITSASCG